MLRTVVAATAVSLLLSGAAAAQSMPLPPSAREPLPGSGKPAPKAKPAKAAKKAPAASGATTSVSPPRPNTAAPKSFDRRFIDDSTTSEGSRFSPTLSPSGNVGIGGRF